jgi:uncharacterized cupredoxin-like copper-binding protein
MNQHPHSEPARLSWTARSGLAAIVAIGALLIAACGGGSGDSDQGGGVAASSGEDSGESGDVRTIEVEMVDNAFSPERVEVSSGETVRFVFSNEGNVTHDAVVGDEADHAEHEDEMREAERESEDGEMGGMGHGSEAEGDEGAITVEPGATGELTYTVGSSAAVLIGCHEPGHYAAGMKLALDLTS